MPAVGGEGKESVNGLKERVIKKCAEISMSVISEATRFGREEEENNSTLGPLSPGGRSPGGCLRMAPRATRETEHFVAVPERGRRLDALPAVKPTRNRGHGYSQIKAEYQEKVE